MGQTSPRGMGQTMSAFKPGVTMTALPTGATNALTMISPRAAPKGNAAAPMGSAVNIDMGSTMNGTMPRDSRAKFLKWFNSLSSRQGQVEDLELCQLESSRQVRCNRTLMSLVL